MLLISNVLSVESTETLAYSAKKLQPRPESPNPCNQMMLAVWFPLAGMRTALIPADIVALRVLSVNWNRPLNAAWPTSSELRRKAVVKMKARNVRINNSFSRWRNRARVFLHSWCSYLTTILNVSVKARRHRMFLIPRGWVSNQF